MAAICGAALVYAIGCSPSTPQDEEAEPTLVRYRTGELAMLQVPGELEAPNPRYPEGMELLPWPEAAPAPAAAFEGPDGAQLTLADLKGNVTVVNMWATWCAPCKVEMPTLNALQQSYADQPLKVVALSADDEDEKEEARRWLSQFQALDFYYTPGMAYTFEFDPAIAGLPTTIIYDKQGVERARLAGDADWNSPEAHALIEALLAEG